MKKNTVTGFVILAFALGMGVAANAQTPEQSARIVNSYDLEAIAELKTQLKEKSEASLKRAYALAELNGWPLKIVDGKGGVAVLSGVTYDDKPLYQGTNNDGPTGSAHTARVTALRTGGSLGVNLRGQGMTMGMWEIGYPRKTHVELTGRIADGNLTDGGTFQSSDANTEEGIHATHVAGTMIGSGINNSLARGIAYMASLRAFNSQNDESEALTEASNPNAALLVSNHSYGFKWSAVVPSNPWLPGAYSEESNAWDQLTFLTPYYLPVFAAGNDRPANAGPNVKDFLLGNATSKNLMIVAAVYALPESGYGGPFTVGMSTFSSWGPTDDRRIKPDISAKGVEVFSTSSQSNTAHEELQGTSMAAPAVAGVVLLLQEYYESLNQDQFMKASTVKGLILNTADEAGDFDGPDFRFGWGLINAEKAAQAIKDRNVSSIIDERTLTQGQIYTRTVTAIGDQPIKATICWTDRAGTQNNGTANSTTPALVNNLDIKIVKTGQPDYFPWKLNPTNLGGAAIKGPNNVDNVETVQVDNAGGTYEIRVAHTGTLISGSQNYSLIVTGVTDVLGVSKNELSSQFGVYPNPVTAGVLNIAPDADFDTANCNVALYDLQGRVVKKYNSFVETIDVSNLSSGVYMLNITKDGATASKKIIID